MISREKYITLSLELHLFFARIMKEHALFLEAGFTPKNTNLSKEAEQKTKYYTGIDINSKITLIEKDLDCKASKSINSHIVKNVKRINARAIKLLDGLIDFKMRILDGMLCCKLFTVNYPSLIEHTIHEAKVYRSYIKSLEVSEDIDKEDIKKTELFWDEVMMEHSLFIIKSF